MLSRDLTRVYQPPEASGSMTPVQSSHAERVALVLAAGKTGVWSWVPTRRELTLDERARLIWGLPLHVPADPDMLLDTVHPDDRDGIRRGLGAAIESDTGMQDDIEIRIRRLDDDRERWIAVQGRPFRDEGGAVSEVIGTIRDISDQKLHDLHLSMLLREITHRSKNLLAIIQAMARQTVKDSLTAEDFEQRLSLRLRGLAASHELLAAQDWHGAHVEELVKGQLSDVIERYPGRIALRGPSIFVKPEAAQNIGLALNELATNAARFGALSNDQGHVEITWALDDETGANQRFLMSWNEFGGPTVAPPQRQGFGHRVVERVAARALDGSVSLTFAPTGLRWSLRIPVSFVLNGRPTGAAGMPKYF